MLYSFFGRPMLCMKIIRIIQACEHMKSPYWIIIRHPATSFNVLQTCHQITYCSLSGFTHCLRCGQWPSIVRKISGAMLIDRCIVFQYEGICIVQILGFLYLVLLNAAWLPTTASLELIQQHQHWVWPYNQLSTWWYVLQCSCLFHPDFLCTSHLVHAVWQISKYMFIV